ncbi:hypothetical protein NP493_926g01013 [Ridgeia piscesae]|uniref:Uncharacterized protein n=1 Tax=Ridgeia piscesae TaxID=27915 RepID=A0AAD9NJZ2_RIDPI|nr:hypothetical protein NP493_926g01013 [Ridgeia piscesae]
MQYSNAAVVSQSQHTYFILVSINCFTISNRTYTFGRTTVHPECFHCINTASKGQPITRHVCCSHLPANLHNHISSLKNRFLVQLFSDVRMSSQSPEAACFAPAKTITKLLVYI